MRRYNENEQRGLFRRYLIPSLCNEEPDLLPPIVGFSLRPMLIRCVQSRLPSLNVRFFGSHPPRPLEELPEHIQPNIYRYANIGRDEVVTVKFFGLAWKGVEAIEQDNYGEKGEGKPGSVRLEARFEDEGVAANALSAQRFMELYVRNGNRHPGQDPGNCRKILKPLENLLGAGRARHVGQ